MTSLSEHLAGAANPEPFQPYAAYLAWVAEDKSVTAWMEKYSPRQPDIQEKISKLAEDVEANKASPAEMLGYVMSCVTFLSMRKDNSARNLACEILHIFSISHGSKASYPQGERYLANLYAWGCNDLDVFQNNEKAQEWLLKAAEGGDLRAQYELGKSKIGTEESEEANLDGLKWLWTAAQGLYPPALTWWKKTLLSDNTTPPGSFLNVERGQIDEMAESCGLLSRLMACAPNDQQAYLETVMAMPHYSGSVMAALEKWEQESPRAIETLVQSLYELACLDRGAPISPTATPDNKPKAAPK